MQITYFLWLHQVLRGADKNINFYFRSRKSLIEKFQWTNGENLDTVINETGLISCYHALVCIW